jgi:Sulfotransferase family
MAIRPLFLFSLPRAGSTLVQRVLAAHPKVASAGEPWVLLPLVYSRRPEGIRAEYGHQLAAAAIDDFAHALPGGPATFDLRLRDFVQQLYTDAAQEGAMYFLDKTPNYLNIVDDLIRLFPEARLLFVWRNPLAVVASLLETFRHGQFEPYAFPTELLRGPAALASAFDANRARAHAVRYEDLLGENRDEHWRGIFDFLELDWDPGVLERFSRVQFYGRFGDQTGSRMYSSLSTEPLEKWKPSFRGAVRQAWGVRWLERIGPAPLEVMGYDPELLTLTLRNLGPARADKVAWDAVVLAMSAMTLRSRLRLGAPDYPPQSIPTRLLLRARRLGLH